MLLKGSITVKYQLYGVSKTYKIVFKKKLTQSIIPFYRIYLDLIFGIIVYNGNQYTVHFLDNAMWLNDVDIMA